MLRPCHGRLWILTGWEQRRGSVFVRHKAGSQPFGGVRVIFDFDEPRHRVAFAVYVRVEVESGWHGSTLGVGLASNSLDVQRAGA